MHRKKRGAGERTSGYIILLIQRQHAERFCVCSYRTVIDPLIFLDLPFDWGLSQCIEASSTNQKGPCKLLAVDAITPTARLSAAEQCTNITGCPKVNYIGSVGQLISCYNMINPGL